MDTDIDAALARLPKSHKIPQTPQYLQHVMAADAEIMLKMDKQIRFLEDQLRRKEAKAMKWKGRYYKIKNNPIYQVWRSTDSCEEFYSWDDTDIETYNEYRPTERRVLFLLCGE